MREKKKESKKKDKIEINEKVWIFLRGEKGGKNYCKKRNRQKSNAKKLFQYIIMSRWIMILVDMGPKFQIKVQKCGFVWKWLVGLCYIITNKTLNYG